MTKDRASTNANAIDTALSKIFGTQAKEKLIGEAALDRWAPDYALQVRIKLPDEINENPIIVGEWRVTLDPPRLSIFSNVSACKHDKTSGLICSSASLAEGKSLAFKNLSLPEVLGLPVGENVRLSEYFTRQTWYIDLLPRILVDSTRPVAAKEYCSNILESAYALGLNRWDSAVALYAMAKTKLASEVRTAMAPFCGEAQRELTAIGLSLAD